MALLPVEDARDRILKGVKPLQSEAVALDKALGRVLAKPLRAMRDQPPFDGSAMDGYAVISADLAATPVTLKLAGTIVVVSSSTITAGPSSAAPGARSTRRCTGISTMRPSVGS